MEKLLFLISIIIFSCSNKDENSSIALDDTMYFPSTTENIWDTKTTSSLNWNENNLPQLYNYLEEKGTKGFIILHNGKIVIEKYFNNHTQSSFWPWYSASKSLTAIAVGIAQDENFIDINNKTSNYLGENWSSLTQEKQDLITVRHHLTMTTGLISNQNNFHEWSCTLTNCMNYSEDAGTTWAYHQGAFIQLQNMISQNVGINFKAYIKNKITDKIGMQGNWNSLGFLNIYATNTRSMARFGLLVLNNGKWNTNIIVSRNYFDAMTNTSQNLNKSYGFLWWLNGKDSFMTTNSETFNGSIIPNAPNDLFAALGANDQKIYVIPSKKLVIVRSGESAETLQLANSGFDNLLWEKINLVIN